LSDAGERRSAAGWRARDPLWAKAPLALLHFPSLGMALVLGSFLLTVAATAYPLFRSSTASDLLNGTIAERTITRYGAGMRLQTLDAVSLGADRTSGRRDRELDRLDDLFSLGYSRAKGGAPLGPIDRSVLGPVVSVESTMSRSEPLKGRLFAGTSALAHVRVIAGDPGPGVWLPDLIADPQRLGPGDPVVMRGLDGSQIQLEVAGVYRSLDETALPGYWQLWGSAIHRSAQGALPPRLILVDEEHVIELARDLGATYAAFGWQAPIAAGREMDLDEARRASRSLTAFADRLRYRSPPGLLSIVGSSMPSVVRKVEAHLATIEGPGSLLQGTGIIVALLVAVAAPTFAVGARRQEGRLLIAQGESPLSAATRAGIESILPSSAGVLTGLASVFLLLGGLGAGGPVTPATIRGVFAGAGAAAAASTILFGLVAGVSLSRESGHRRVRRRHPIDLPWELALLALAFVSWRRLQGSGAFVADPVSGVDRPSLLLVAFPLLLLAGLSIVGARLFRASTLLVRNHGRRLSHPSFLATRRLAGRSGLTMLLVALTVLCLGIFVEAETSIRSLRTTVDAKSRAFVGSDVQARVDRSTPVPDSFPFPLARASRLLAAGSLSNGTTFDLLTIDATAFTHAAYWNDAFSETSIGTIVRLLRSASGGTLPVVAAGRPPQDITSIEVAQKTMSVDVVATATAFPGMSSLRPLVVADEGAFLDAIGGSFNPLGLPRATTEFWIRGDEDAIVHALQRLPYQPHLVIAGSEVRNIPYISAAIGTFVILEVLALVAAVLVMAGTLLYLQARERSQVVSYGLSLRMGMTHTGHRRALVYELGSILAWSYALAVVLAILAAILVVPKLDPLPVIPPGPLLIVPTWSLVVGTMGLAVLAGTGGWLTNVRARRMDFGRVMRIAE
jgi:hypothetical protein